MDILSDYRITALTVRERDLAQRAERVRVADERTEQQPGRALTSTGSLACVPIAH